jgi:hypothetical protein
MLPIHSIRLGRTAFLLFLSIPAFCLLACGHTEATPPPVSMDTVMQAVRAYGRGHQALLTPTVAEKPDQPDEAYSAHIRNILVQEDFAQLEKIAQQNRAEKGRLLGGLWKTYAFYTGTSLPASAADPTESDFQLYAATLKKWIAAYPNSTAARISLAELCMNNGWHSRGSGTADTVSDSQWEKFADGTAKAKAILLEVAKFEEKDPMWYQVMLMIAQSEGWEKTQARELFDQAIAFEPGFYHYYRAYANLLLPQWYGEPGELEAFAQEITKHVAEPDGSILYFQTLSALDCYCKPSIKALLTTNYAKIRQGYLNNVRLYGVTNLTANRFAFVASMFNDRAAAHEAFASVDKMDGDIWLDEAAFQQYRAWASAQ